MHEVIYISFHPDIPWWKASSTRFEDNNTFVIVLGDMFDGGGVPIDHYIIQVDNGTHSWKLQAPLTVLTSCTIIHCQ